jgi:hypothetical protein
LNRHQIGHQFHFFNALLDPSSAARMVAQSHRHCMSVPYSSCDSRRLNAKLDIRSPMENAQLLLHGRNDIEPSHFDMSVDRLWIWNALVAWKN